MCRGCVRVRRFGPQFWNLGQGYSPSGISDTGVVVGTDDFAGQYFMWTPSGGAVLIGGVSANDGYGGQATISNDLRIGGPTSTRAPSSAKPRPRRLRDVDQSRRINR